MGLKDEMLNLNVSVNNEDVAKGIVLAWTAVAAADGKIGQGELVLLNNFAKDTPSTKKFYNEKWLADIFQEALKIIKEGGLNALYPTIANYFTNAVEGDKQALVYSLMLLAIFEEDFSQQEMEAVNQIVETLDIPRKHVLFTGMVFAGRSRNSFK